MEILFVTAEVFPVSSFGPASQVCAALPKAFRSLGHHVTVLSPLYRGIDPVARSLARRLTKVEVSVAGHSYACEVYDGRTAAGINLMFLGHEELFGSAQHMREGDERAAALRAGVFARAAAAVARTRDPAIEILHGHDWLGALAIHHAASDRDLTSAVTILTVHDPESPGTFGREHAEALGLEGSQAPGIYYDGKLQALAAGIAAARHVTTSSPSYATELANGAVKHTLGDAFSTCGERFSGIANGVDASIWNPATDPRLPFRFDPIQFGGKQRCRQELAKRVGLPARADAPLFGALVEPGERAGFDLLARIAPDLLRNDVQLALIAEKPIERALADVLLELEERYPDRLRLKEGVDEPVKHLLFAGSDFLVVPTRHDASGLTPMIAHRYGALPIARRIAAHADTIVDADAAFETGSGFTFERDTAEELLAAVQRAASLFSSREKLVAMQRRIMRVDHSWERSARLYERLYRTLLETRTAAA